MDLILWRHAEAEVAPEGGDDLSRSLTKKGERQAMRMAAWLDRHLPEGTRVLVSPSRRTQQTVAPLGRKFKLRDELVPETSVEDVLTLLKWHPETGPQLKGPVLLVGHQPYLGELVAKHAGHARAHMPCAQGRCVVAAHPPTRRSTPNGVADRRLSRTYFEFLGRPVLMVGTLFKAALN